MDRLPPTARLIGIGGYFAFCIIAGILGSVLLADWLGISRALLGTIGMFVGLIAAFWGGYVLLMETLGPHKPQGRKDG